MTGEADAKLVLVMIQIFRDVMHAHLNRLLAVQVDERMLMYAIAAETLSIAASAHGVHDGGREEFLQMARDAYALRETGEFEQ